LRKKIKKLDGKIRDDNCYDDHEAYNISGAYDIKSFKNFSIAVDNAYCSTVGK
jgi:hypothetical protein